MWGSWLILLHTSTLHLHPPSTRVHSLAAAHLPTVRCVFLCCSDETPEEKELAREVEELSKRLALFKEADPDSDDTLVGSK